MTRRTGMTLIEVLVAIFVMGIGLIAVLALFPLGIFRIAQSIHDSKSVSSLVNANSIAQLYNLGNDLDVRDDTYQPFGAAPLADLFVNPYPAAIGGTLPNADPQDMSYPIFADPVGFFATNGIGDGQHWVGSARGFLRRRPVWFVRNGAATLPALQLNVWRNFTLWDDVTFDGGDPLAGSVPGTPTVLSTATTPATIARDSRFSWAYVFRRPQTAERAIVDCSVVIFDTRQLSLTGGLTLPEYVYTTTYYDAIKNTITIAHGGATLPPPIRPGNWIMDITPYQTQPLPQGPLTGASTAGSAHAYFYRVVAVDDMVIGVQAYTRYEVAQPLRGFTNPATGMYTFPTMADPTDLTGTRQVVAGTSIVIEGIAEVFDRGSIRLP